MSSPFDRGRPDVWRENEGLSKLPKSPGAYRFVDDKSKTIDYIGITSNIYGRISFHRSARPEEKKYYRNVHRVEFQAARADHDWEQLQEWEVKKICYHDPKLNISRGGGGRVSRLYSDKGKVELREGESIEDAVIRKGLFGRLLGLFQQ